MAPSFLDATAALVFALALIHTFATGPFERLSQRFPRHGGMFHLLAEVEIVFGFWAVVLIVALFGLIGFEPALRYVDSRDYTEPMFVFAIMVVAGSRPILELSEACVRALARILPLDRSLATYCVALAFLPLLGSFITEPAAMTLAALLLRDRVFRLHVSESLKYATLGVVFVNISIGGTLTSFAAPPVLMVAGKWAWDTAHMFSQFGWKAAIAVLVNAVLVTAVFRNEIRAHATAETEATQDRVPVGAMIATVLFLAAVVLFAHYPAMFMGVLLLFLGYSAAYPRHHDNLILREALLVAFFLAGLVVIGGLQKWWLEPLLLRMSADAIFWAAIALTAVTDNAALTYLGSLVEGLSDAFKYALVAGAVTGGGLTVIANAPNPAGYSIVRRHFPGNTISASKLLLASLAPTLIAATAFLLL